jgi:LysM repeat protein
MHTTNDEEYVYVYGAIQMHELKMSGNDYVIDDDTWKKGYEDCKQYFEDGEMLGWFVAHAGVALSPAESTVELHKKAFHKANTVFIMKDPVEEDEVYFVQKYGDLMEMSGHFTYYEKNPCMQNYMISCRKKNGASPSETVEDRAAKDFRSLVRSREEAYQQRRANRLMYAVSACLVLVVIVMGVTTLNNVDRMKLVQEALNNISDNREPQSVEVTTTNGNLTTTVGESTEIENGQAEEDVANEETSTPAEEATVEETVQTPSNNSNVYVVKSGDTLASISIEVYGTMAYVDDICQANGMKDEDLIYIGQELLIP